MRSVCPKRRQDVGAQSKRGETLRFVGFVVPPSPHGFPSLSEAKLRSEAPQQRFNYTVRCERQIIAHL